LRIFAIQLAFSFPCISRAIKVQISYPGTPLETREQELSFGTKIYGILFNTIEDISSKKTKKTQGFVATPVVGVLHQ